MAAYWISRCKIDNPVEYKKYTDLVPGIIAQYGGRVMARGGRFQIMEGTDKFTRFVVIEFDTFEQAVKCNQSPEYQAPRHVSPRTRRGRGRSDHCRRRRRDTTLNVSCRCALACMLACLTCVRPLSVLAITSLTCNNPALT